jgi:hypothetical protein
MNTTSQMDIDGMKVAIDGDENAKIYPHFPEGLLPVNEETDPAKYEGDMENMTERLRFKTFQVWNSWSSLLTNETLIKKLALTKEDSKDCQYVKACLVLFIDRVGKILADTDIVEEMKRET